MNWIVFPDVRAAVIWAEEFATRPNIKCPLGNLRQYMIHEHDAATRDDMLDLALTITGMVSSISVPAGPAYRAIYGDISEARIMEIAGLIAEQQYRVAGKLPAEKLLGLARGVMLAYIEHDRFGRRYGLRKIASDAGIDRNTLKANMDWVWAFADAQNTLKTWMLQAERELGVRMDDMGLLRVDEVV